MRLFEDLAEKSGSDLQSSIRCHRRGVSGCPAGSN